MSASDNITAIQQLFRKVLEETITEGDLDFLSNDFHSIPFEAYSAKLAISELRVDGALSKWTQFKDRHSAKHNSQLFVGLGWAIAETSTDPGKLNLNPTDSEFWRVGDGMGYFYGLFKRRESIRQQVIPNEVVSNNLVNAYLQGLGRSIFYLSSADGSKCKQLVNLFSLDKQKHLWRGVGLAFGYVGGSNSKALHEFLAFCDPFEASFKSGLLIAEEGKSKGGDSCNDIKLYLGQLSLNPITSTDNSISYREFLTQLENSLK